MMMAQSGLSVAYRAKPATRAKADVAINFGGLDALLKLFDEA
jgi:phosphoserine phosphatase